MLLFSRIGERFDKDLHFPKRGPKSNRREQQRVAHASVTRTPQRAAQPFVDISALKSVIATSMNSETESGPAKTNIQLVNQAKSSDPNERLAAVSLIGGLLCENENAAEFISIGVLPVLVNCLESTDDKLFAEAAKAFVETSREVREVVEAGALPSLVKLLQSENMELCKKTVDAFGEITSREVREVVEAGALPPLVKLLQSENMDLCKETLSALGEIAEVKAREVAEAGAVPPLVKLLQSPDMDLCASTALLVAKIVGD
uniref:Uncharacterized protein n=1 Tax=Globodera rostochiensis TaxID=31243 RepID=A0A914HIA0_GLORO